MIQKKLLLFCALAMPYSFIAGEKNRQADHQVMVGLGAVTVLVIVCVALRAHDQRVKKFASEQLDDLCKRRDELLKIHQVFINNPSLEQTKECKRLLDAEEQIYQLKEKMYPSYHKDRTSYTLHRRELNAVANIELTYQRVLAGEKLGDVLAEYNATMSYEDMQGLIHVWISDCRYGITFYADRHSEQRQQYVSKGYELLRILEKTQKALLEGKAIDIEPSIIKVPSAREQDEANQQREEQKELERLRGIQQEREKLQLLIQSLAERAKSGESLLAVLLEMHPGIDKKELKKLIEKIRKECEARRYNDFSDEYNDQCEFVEQELKKILAFVRKPAYAYARCA